MCLYFFLFFLSLFGFYCFFFFFFQAEDGIRDRDVTGVQTCALPISRPARRPRAAARAPGGGPPRASSSAGWPAPGRASLPCPAAPPTGASPCGPTGGSRRSGPPTRDRKSTRLNSSHITISYAVFCLK